MKIGILTFHRAGNYGAVLQAYALQKAMEKMGTDCEIIDYRNEVIEKSNQVFFLMSDTAALKHITAAVLNAPLRLYRKLEFRSFLKKYLKLSAPVFPSEREKCNSRYDLIIVGSDQVWNDKLTNSDGMYLLDCITDPGKKHSYAASFGFREVPENLTGSYKANLSAFSHISVREETGRQIIRKLLGRDASVNVDPTFLVKGDAWEELYRPVRNKGNYILVYSINQNNHLIDFAKNLGRKKNLPVIYILLDITEIKRYRGMKFIFSPSPQKFISLIRDADTVVTNSFHGTVFSVIFQKAFYSEIDYGDNKFNYRIESLLQHLKLENRLIKSAQPPEKQEQIDWERTYRLLAEYRENSLGYLKQVVS